MSDLVRMSLSLERPLYQRLEQMVEESGYSNRSEFVRDMIRGQMVKQAWEGDEEALGTITLIYDHHQRELNARLTHLQHHCNG
ncbi:MAG: ribbon-helix-helix protein, CopG family, partial [Planctomycetota bacterium]